MSAHKNDLQPRILFGRTYVWLRTESGRLCLVSMTALSTALAKAKKALDE